MLSLSGHPDISIDVKCHLCEKFLSVPPVYHNGTGNICGRCTFVNKDKEKEWSRQWAYESLAKHLKFPCSNAMYDCKCELTWNEVEEHENTCLYKKLNCPLNDGESFNAVKCKWVGSGPSLNEHIENAHADLIKRLPDFDFGAMTSSAICFTRVAKQLMIVVVKIEGPEKYHCLVMANGTSANCDDYRYQLELHDDVRKDSMILRRNRVEDAVGMEENLLNPDKMLIVNLAVIKEFLKNPDKVIGRFGILKKSKKEIASQMQQHNQAVLDENFLRELECPICKCYLAPPIYICSTGHSFCQRCKSQLRDCPSCRNPFHQGRNFALEKLTSLVNYPCVYRDAGCYAILNSNAIRDHEKDCPYSGNKCFLKCPPSGSYSNMFVHLNSVHKDAMIVSGELQILDLNCEDDPYFYYALCYGNDIFKLTVEVGETEDPTKFWLQQFGVEESRYSYEVEVICSTDSNQRLSIMKECAAIESSSTNEERNCVSIPYDLFSSYITDEDLIFFKVHIKKD